MSKQFKGETGDLAPFINASIWKKEKKLVGVVKSRFTTSSGLAFVVELLKPINIDGESTKMVSIGLPKGLIQAMRTAGIPEVEIPGLKESLPVFLPNDQIVVEMTGERATGQESPMQLFKVELTRD